ncbi:MAG TPA: hypothetical protein VNK04_00045 [Gemmataceae bacterium]|nr:hypothetical protein [Gemmataceae bacterium]
MRCPVCKAENDAGPQCRRCRADLALLFALEEQRRRALAEAYRHLARSRLRQALALAEGADTLRRDVESQRLLAMIHLLHRDFARAWQAYAFALSVNRDSTHPV